MSGRSQADGQNVSEDFPISWRYLLGRARHALTLDEQRIIEEMIGPVERVSHDHAILRDGELADRSTYLIEGFMARTIERDGRRHIVSMHVPGDFVDLHAFALKRLDHSVVAIGPAKVGYVPHPKLVQVVAAHPHLSRMLWFSTLLEAAIHREWILTMEHLPIEGRLAHLMAELWHRLSFVGLGDEDGFNLPLTQVEIADACGTTPIHLNRVVRSLREAGIMELSRGRVTILDRPRLEQAGKFRPDYLYGEGHLKLGDELSK